MKTKPFIGIPLIVASLALSFIVVDQLLCGLFHPENNSGFSWISFQAWAVYFLAGSTPKSGSRALLGYIMGIIAVPIATFIMVTAIMFTEKLPPFDFIPATFIGAGAMVCFLNYIDGTSYPYAALVIICYCSIGLFYGYLTVSLRTAYEKVSKKR
jgi:hypothetical protein